MKRLFDSEFSVNGRPVGFDYVLSVYKELGAREFLRVNPWILNYAVDAPANHLQEPPQTVIDTEFKPPVERYTETEYTNDIDTWCEKEDQQLAKRLEARWGIADAKTFIDKINENRYSRIRQMADEMDVEPQHDGTIEGDESDTVNMNSLRNMYKFSKKKKPRF